MSNVLQLTGRVKKHVKKGPSAGAVEGLHRMIREALQAHMEAELATARAIRLGLLCREAAQAIGILETVASPASTGPRQRQV